MWSSDSEPGGQKSPTKIEKTVKKFRLTPDKEPDPVPDSLEMLDPDSMNADPQHRFQQNNEVAKNNVNNKVISNFNKIMKSPKITPIIELYPCTRNHC